MYRIKKLNEFLGKKVTELFHDPAVKREIRNIALEVEVGDTYDNNTDAVAALGPDKLYKSSTLVNGSPIILITV